MTTKPLLIGKTARLRAKIVEYLRGGPPRTSNEIRDHINKTLVYGTSKAVLNNILGKDPRFVKVGTTQNVNVSKRVYVISVWELDE